MSTEHDEQAALFEWAELAAIRDGRLSLLFAIPNGGHRHISVAVKLKAEGVKRGVPDICLPVPNEHYYGLWIELKAEKGKPTLEQNQWITALNEQGYRAVVCKGWNSAAQEIENYLGG